MMDMNKFKNAVKLKSFNDSDLYKIDYDLDDKVVPALLLCIKCNDLGLKNYVFDTIKKVNGNNNVVQYYDYSYDANEGYIYIISECLDSIDKKYQNSLCDEETTVEIAKNVILGLANFHINGFIHNNIKIDNIFISDNRYKLGLFDVVSKDNLNVNTDIYQIGLLMYRLLSGGLPFGLSSYDAVLEKQNSGEKISYLENVSSGLMNIIIKALEIDKSMQYSDINEMFNDLTNLNLDTEKIVVSNDNNVKVRSGDTLDIENISALRKASFKVIDSNRRINFRDFFKKLLFILSFILFFGGILMVFASTKDCKKGYINRFGLCVKGHYTCKDGYELDKNKCLKVVKTLDAHKTYTCPDNFVYQNGVCVYDDIKDPERTYKCADEFTLNGKKCVKEIHAAAPVIYTCPENYVLAGSKCVTLNSFDATKNYYCPNESYVRNGSLCVKDVETTTNPLVTYGCARGGSYTNGRCVLTQNATYDSMDNPVCPNGSSYNYNDQKCYIYYSPTPSYSCITGNLTSDNKCSKKSTTTIIASSSYSCPDGYILVGDKCTNSATISAHEKYACTDDMELRDGNCYGKIITDALSLYTCPDGYILSGILCVRDDFVEPDVKYSCSRLYKLNDDKCEKYKVLKAKAHYN